MGAGQAHAQSEVARASSPTGLDGAPRENPPEIPRTREMHGTVRRCVRSAARARSAADPPVGAANPKRRVTSDTHPDRWSERPPDASDLCRHANGVTYQWAPNDYATRGEMPERGSGLGQKPDALSIARHRQVHGGAGSAPPAPGEPTTPYGRALESCRAPSGSDDPQSFASESGRRRSSTNSAPMSLDAGRSR